MNTQYPHCRIWDQFEMGSDNKCNVRYLQTLHRVEQQESFRRYVSLLS